MSLRLLATVTQAGSIKLTGLISPLSSFGRCSRVYPISPAPKPKPKSNLSCVLVPRNICVLKSRAMTSAAISPEANARLDKVRDAVIDETGRFKYILIKVYAEGKNGENSDSNSKFIVRGRADCPYHGDIYDKYREEIENIEGIDDEILGGGRIERSGNKISVFGYSQGYGRADHTITVEILKRYFPQHDITWSNDGY